MIIMAGMNLPKQIERALWDLDLRRYPQWRRGAVYLGRAVYVILGKFMDGMLTLRATSLVYTTLLSLVPLLAVSFGVLSSFGVRNQLEPTLQNFLDPLGERKQEIVHGIVSFVENLQVGGVLSSLGMVMLVYTIVSMTHKVERAFNDIWNVHSPRSLARRFSDYLSVIIIGPVLFFTCVSLTRMAMHTSVMIWLSSVEPFGTLLFGLSRLAPYAIACAAFAFLYGFVPNTKVRFITAVVGGVFTGLLWSANSILFANTIARSANYSAIYASFAGVVLFIVWMYFGWLIILVGAQVSFYWQNPRFLDPRIENAKLNDREREEIAIELMVLIGRAHFIRGPQWNATSLQHYRPEVPPNAILELLDVLMDKGLLVTTNGDTPCYLPARDIETIPVREVLAAVRGAPTINPGASSVNAIMDEIDAAIERILGDKTLEDLILEDQQNQHKNKGRQRLWPAAAKRSSADG